MLDDNNNNSQSAILKRNTIDEEVRLAFTTPSYISYTLKNIQKIRFLFLLSLCLKKKSLQLAYLILAREKVLTDIFDKIEMIELFEKAKKKMHIDFEKNKMIFFVTKAKKLHTYVDEHDKENTSAFKHYHHID